MKERKFDSEDIRQRLKDLREARGLSMRELAARSDLSVSLISKVESGRISPTVMTLQKILDGMEVDLYDFLLDGSDNDPSEQVVFKASDMAISEDSEHQWRYAFPKHPDIGMQLMYEEYAPFTMATEMENHKSDFCGFVVAGELTIEIEDKGRFTAGEGDAFYIKANTPHIAQNEGEQTLKLVTVYIR